MAQPPTNTATPVLRAGLTEYGRIRQLDLSVGVAYKSDLDQALAALDEIVGGNPRVLHDPAAIIGVSSLGDSSIRIAVRPWVSVTDFVAAGAEINKAIVETFRARDIVIPSPQREVRLVGAAIQAVTTPPRLQSATSRS